MMNRNRAEASLPMRSLITRSVMMWSLMSTRSSRRVLGFKVVSHSTLGIISPSPLKRVISGVARPGPGFAVLGDDRVALGIVERPVRLLADVDPVKRRLRQVDLAVGNQLRQMPIDERQQQGGDVVAVRVGIGQQDDLAVAQPGQVEVLAQAASQRGDEVRQLLVFQDLGQRGTLDVEDLAAQRQNRLPGPIASLLGRSAGGVALDDEQLASDRAPVRAVTELAGQVQPVRRGALARHLLVSGATGFARPGGQDHPCHDRLGHRPVVMQPMFQGRTDGRVDSRRQFRIVEPVLGLPLELGVGHEHAEDADETFAQILGGERHALGRQVMGLDEIAHRLAESGAQPVLVCATRPGRDTVDVAPQALLGRFRPLQDEPDADAVAVGLLEPS